MGQVRRRMCQWQEVGRRNEVKQGGKEKEKKEVKGNTKVDKEGRVKRH